VNQRKKKERHVRWTKEQYEEHMRKFHSNTKVSIANVEPNTVHAPAPTNAPKKINSPVHIRIHSKRKRLCDSDGICGKFAIDAIVRAGILQDDSPKHVKNVSFSQEKCGPEETVITLSLN